MSSSFRKLGVRRSAPGAETETTQTFHIADPAVSSNDAKESFPRRHSDRNSFLVACGVTLTCVSRHSDSRTPTIGKEEGGRRKEEGDTDHASLLLPPGRLLQILVIERHDRPGGILGGFVHNFLLAISRAE